MEKNLKVKELRKELLELEGRELQDGAKPANDKVVSGLIVIAIGGICLTYGLGYEIEISIISGVIALLVGIYQISAGKSSLAKYEEHKLSKEQKIISIKKELLDLE